MLKFERLFRTGILILFAVNVLSTLASMSLIERMIPSHDEEYMLIVEQEKALLALFAVRVNAVGPGEPAGEALGTILPLLQDKKAWTQEQHEYLDVIQKVFQRSDEPNALSNDEDLRAWQALYAVQQSRKDEKLESFRNAGLAGSWVVGSISLLSLLVLYLFQLRVKRQIVYPSAELVRGLNDWWAGNRQRRLRCPNAKSEIHDCARIVNDILDDA